MRRDIVTSVIAIVVFTILLGLVYPLVITGVSQVAFPGNANGQRLYVKGRLVGSKLIGQSFSGNTRYFQSRPSGTKPAYNAAESTFTNLGPNSVKTEEAITQRIRAYLSMERPYIQH
jgi:K+-transporting ATPase ATPase C chain